MPITNIGTSRPDSNFFLGSSPSTEFFRADLRTPLQLEVLQNLLRTTNPAAGGLSSLAALEQAALGGTGGTAGREISRGSQTLGGADQALTRLLSGRASPLQREASGALSTALGGEPLGFDDFFNTAVAAPLQERFFEDILPGVNRQFDPFSSGRISGTVDATEDLVDALATARADLAFRSQEGARDRALTAAGLVPALAASRTDPILRALSVAPSLAAGRAGLAETATSSESQLLNALAQAGNLETQLLRLGLGIDPFENIVINTAASPGFLPSFGAGLAPGIGQGLGAALFSGFGPIGTALGGAAGNLISGIF